MSKQMALLTILMAYLIFPLQAQTAKEKEVGEVVEKLRKAMIEADQSQLELLAAEELNYGHSSGLVENKKEFVEALVSGKSDFVTIDLSDQTVKVVGNTALVRHTLTGETLNDGTPGTVKIGVLLVWINQKGQWKLLGRQAYKL